MTHYDGAAVHVNELINTAIHVWMHGAPRHPDLGTHVALELGDHYRIEIRHKSRSKARMSITDHSPARVAE